MHRKDLQMQLIIRIRKEKLKYLRKEFKVKLFLGFFLILILHVSISAYLVIFGNINSNSQKNLLIFYGMTFVLYHIIYWLVFIFITGLRCISLNVPSFCFEEIFFLSSASMAEYF